MAAMSPELKSVNRFLIQAKKMDKVRPVIAYYLRLYAVTQAMKIEPRTSEITEFVVGLMGKLEADKTDETADKDGAKVQVESFALMVFNAADSQDRAGQANRKTLQAFNSSYILMEMLSYFGEISAEVQERYKYAKWKAADYAKAFKEGRTPTPGPPGADTEGEAAAAPANGASVDGSGKDHDGDVGMGGESENKTPLSEAPPPSSSSSPPMGRPDMGMQGMDMGMGMGMGMPSMGMGMPGGGATPTAAPSSSAPFGAGASGGPGGMSFPSLSGGRGGPSSFPPHAPAASHQPQPTHAPTTAAAQNPHWHQPAPNRGGGGMPPSQGNFAPSGGGNGGYAEIEQSVKVLTKCEKLTKHAMSAMRFSDPDSSIEKLETIISMLRPISKRYR